MIRSWLANGGLWKAAGKQAGTEMRSNEALGSGSPLGLTVHFFFFFFIFPSMSNGHPSNWAFTLQVYDLKPHISLGFYTIIITNKNGFII
jgi:hypothetical protein